MPRNPGDGKYACQSCGDKLNPLEKPSARGGRADKSLLEELAGGIADRPGKSSCPACGAEMRDGTILCCKCGLDTRTGQRLKTKVRDDTASAARYNRIVTVCGIVGASLGVVALICCLVAFFGYGGRMSLRAFFLPVVGWLLGVGAACAVAPPNFFRTPSAERWLSLIGTYNPVLARAVCISALAVILGVAALIAYLAFSTR